MISKRTHRPCEHRGHAGLPIWKETLFGVDFLLLCASPVYYGYEVPRGDGSAVIVIPGFLGTDPLTRNLHEWLRRIGYRPYRSGIGLNADCPNIIVKERLTKTVLRAVLETGRKVHLIGHSLGGMLARGLAAQLPEQVASVTTLGSPVKGMVIQKDIFSMAEGIRRRILEQHGPRVLPTCYTGSCTCDFSRSLSAKTSTTVIQTAIYTRSDGVIDWRYCLTDDPDSNFEVPGTHVGLLFNQSAYRIIAQRLQQAQ